MRTFLKYVGALVPIIAGAALVNAGYPIVSPVYAAEAEGDRIVLPTAKTGRSRPLVVVVAENGGAETTDFVVPYGVLKDSGVAEVRSLSTSAGPVKFTRGLRITADETIAQFDAREPAGADIVIVPAQAAPKDAALAKWVKVQAAKGATVISVCEGARVLANAGLLDGKRAVTHFSAIEGLAKAYPGTTWVRDRRYLQDGAVISTTGVTASIPMSLALVEAIGGLAVARATAQRVGVETWGSEHRTADFVLEKADVDTAMRAMRDVATHETVEVPIEDGVDEVRVALQADAWGRTYRTTVVTTHPNRSPVTSRHGLVILPDAEARPGRYVLRDSRKPPATQLDEALAEMGQRYGPGAIRLASLGMEYASPRDAGR